MLNWKIGDTETKERALRTYEKQLDLYSDLVQRALPMGKLLGDISNMTPQGIEWENISLSQDRNFSMRGLAKAQDDLSGTEVILALETQMRESKIFDKVTKRWDPPDSKGMLKFTLAATVTRPTLRPNFKEEQDFARKTLAQRRYPPTPAKNDSALPANAEEHTAKSDGIPASNSTANAADESSSVPKDIPSIDPLNDPAPHATDAAPGATVVSSTKPTKPVKGQPSDKSNSAPTETSDTASDTTTQKKTRGARTTTSVTNDLPKRSERTPDSANVATPIPEPISDTELNAMSKDELQAAMAKVALARQSAEVNDQTKKFLKDEFDKIKNALKGKQ